MGDSKAEIKARAIYEKGAGPKEHAHQRANRSGDL